MRIKGLEERAKNETGLTIRYQGEYISPISGRLQWRDVDIEGVSLRYDAEGTVTRFDPGRSRLGADDLIRRGILRREHHSLVYTRYQKEL